MNFLNPRALNGLRWSSHCLVHTYIIWNAWYIYISLVSRQAVTTVDAENRKQDR